MGEYFSRITFYDVMGYFLPGFIGMIALLAGASALNPTWSVKDVSGAVEWLLFVVATYFLGHIVQALSNLCMPRSSVRNKVATNSSAEALQIVRKALSVQGEHKDNVIEQYALLDAHKLNFPDREIFIARQGFYRGSSFAFFFLGSSLLISLILPNQSMLFGFIIDNLLSGLLLVLSIGVAVLFAYRYRDFIRHELEHAAAAGTLIELEKDSEQTAKV